jgi:hypothetical protein
VYLYFFQSWCPGCHTSGFPTLQAVQEALNARGLAGQGRFMPVQTVFEDHDANTADAAVESLAWHGLDLLPVGHDSGTPPPNHDRLPHRWHPVDRARRPRPTDLVDGFHLHPNELLGHVLHHAEQHPPKETHA